MSAHGYNLLKNNTKVKYNLTRVFAGLLCLPRPTEYFFLIINANVVLYVVDTETEHTISTFWFSRVSAGKNWVKIHYGLDG